VVVVVVVKALPPYYIVDIHGMLNYFHHLISKRYNRVLPIEEEDLRH
jgi:hypothetical protein